MFNLTKFRMARLFAFPRRFGSIIKSEQLKVLKDDTPPPSIQLLPPSCYGGEHHVSLLTGSTSLGKQASNFITTLFKTAKVPVYFEEIAISDVYDENTTEEFLLSVRRNRSAIYVDIQHDPRTKRKSLMLASDLDLYACAMKMDTFSGFNSNHCDLDIMLIIQNNSGDYSKLEYEPVPGLVETLKICDAKVVRRFLRFMFTYAKKHCRQKIAIAHKVNEIPKTDGMFLDIASELQVSDFPDIEVEFMTVNDLVMHLIMNPEMFDVICSGDRYGTFIASICSAVCGGASLFSATEMGDNHAVFKPLQMKLSLTDSKVLSPYGVVRACIDLLKHLGKDDCAHALWQELMRTMLVDKIKTPEFGGCNEGEFVICNIVNKLKCNVL